MKAKKKIVLSHILEILLALSLLIQPNNVRAHPAELIQKIDLVLSTDDISRVEFGYHYSSFESYHIEYKLEVKAGKLTDENIELPLSTLSPLLSGLRGMYPGTRPLIWQAWTDDYPHAWVYLYLKDGRVVNISSDSQFESMFPWNVALLGSDKAILPDAVYIQLNSTLLNGIDTLWRKVGEDGFPRKGNLEWYWQDVSGDQIPATVKFNVPLDYSYDTDGSDTVLIWGANPEALTPFLPALIQNIEIKTLLDAGYYPFDAAFTLEVETKTLKPVQYSGTLALATPDGKDAVIGLVTLPVGEEQTITTTLIAEEAFRLVEQRRASKFLNEASQILTHLTFLLDTRDDIRIPTLNCPKNPNISLDGKIIQAIWNPAQPLRITFFPLTDKRWSMDLSIKRGETNWSDTAIKTILKAWFPISVAELPIQNFQEIDTRWKIAFQPDVTLRDPELLNRLYSELPEETVIHKQNPEKIGDYGFLSLKGRVVISENNSSPTVVYCGDVLPDWYGPEYSIGSVIPPNDLASRYDMSGKLGKNGEWYSLREITPPGEYRASWTSIAFTQPGFLHVLWSQERNGVYYADGWIDGTGWTKPQRLGDFAYWSGMRSWPDGEIHLFWGAGLRTGGAIHVWRPAGGIWQKPEHWPIAYFSEILRDANGVLHIGLIESDGLDSEFMHRTWSPGKGLSDPENISRQIGDIGNTTTVLRIDSDGQLHAAWSHILEQKSSPDPLTGETSDIAGVFYAHQTSDGQWSKPEKIGTLAAYAHALSMELDFNGNPLIVWQADNGLVSRIRKNNAWEGTIELAQVTPPETPAEFGADRWVQPTAELSTGTNTLGQIIIGWNIPYSGIRLAFWTNDQWTDTIDVITPDESGNPDLYPPIMHMVVDNQDQVHLVFFSNSQLCYASFDGEKVEIKSLPIFIDSYGVPEASLIVDTAESVAILGLPRTPKFVAKIPGEGIPPTPTATPVPSNTPENTPTPPSQYPNKYNSLVPLFIGLGIISMLIVIWIIVKFKKIPVSK